MSSDITTSSNTSPNNSSEEAIRPTDDWSGLSQAERRKRQNRVNQQAWRRRRQTLKRLEQIAEFQRQRQHLEAANRSAVVPFSVPDLTILAQFIQEKHQRDQQRPDGLPGRPNVYQLLALFESAAYHSYMTSPNADHRLTLVKLNVFRAFVRVLAILGYARSWMSDDALSPFSTHGPHQEDRRALMPASLQPTPLQISQPHHPWLDFFPFASLRDNLIRNEDYMDDSQLCRDLMGFWTMPSEQDNCMLVWGDPWDPMNWEVTETFLKKWGWLVKGCPEIIWSTNYWREKRGQPKIKWKNSLAPVAPVDHVG